LFDANTTELGKPVGKDSSLKTWQGDQWKIGGGDTWGWYSYDPQLNLIYYGSGNPSTWNPAQRPGDNKWSMTIFARNPDTGVAKWVFQMTPHDEGDLPRRARLERPAAGRLFAKNRALLRADEPRLHGL